MISVPPSTLRLPQSIFQWYSEYIHLRYDEADLWYNWYTTSGRRPRVMGDFVTHEQSLVVAAMYLGIPEIEIILSPKPVDRELAAYRILGTFDQVRKHGNTANNAEGVRVSDGTDRLEGSSGIRVELRDLKSSKKRGGRGRSGRR